MAASRPLQKLLALIERYVVMTPEQRLIVALWIVHTYFVHGFDQTPYLAVTSPERQCGKSRLLELLQLLVARPWYAINPSEAVLYRELDRSMRTLLLDEVDTIFNPKTAHYHEGIRAVLDAGHRNGATVPRCTAFGNDVEHFTVYSAKVLAGIGSLPATIADRAIPIRLQRKTRAEEVARFYTREAETLAAPVREAMLEFATNAGNAALITESRPALPEELSDRMQEGCEPLIAIADALGYGDEARAALVEILTAERADTTEAWSQKLLRAIRSIFDANPEARAMKTADLVQALHDSDEDWRTYYGRGLGSRDMGTLLSHYEIHPLTVRVGDTTAKGYKRDDFADAWSRYLSETPMEVGAGDGGPSV